MKKPHYNKDGHLVLDVDQLRRVKKILAKALELLAGGKKWTKYTMDDGHGNMCAVGAVRKAHKAVTGVNCYHHSSDTPEYLGAYDFLGSVISDKFEGPIGYNDDNNRGWPGVRGMFTRAIKACDAVIRS